MNIRTLAKGVAMGDTKYIGNIRITCIPAELQGEMAEILKQHTTDEGVYTIADKLSVYAESLNGNSILINIHVLFRLLDLISTLTYMQPGDILDHPWGYIRRVEDGFRVAGGREENAKGNWHSENVLALANEMLEGELHRLKILTV